MQVTRFELDGVLMIDPLVFCDQRGFFMESYNRQRYHDVGLALDFVQDNLSFSQRGTLRGMHFQNPQPQGKLVSVFHGEIFAVAVDIRQSSSTFRRWVGVTLSSGNKRQFWVPHGFAHGFAVTSEAALVHYKCSSLYSQKDEAGFRWNDPEIGIEWPLLHPTLSPRDKRAPLFNEVPTERLF